VRDAHYRAARPVIQCGICKPQDLRRKPHILHDGLRQHGGLAIKVHGGCKDLIGVLAEWRHSLRLENFAGAELDVFVPGESVLQPQVTSEGRIRAACPRWDLSPIISLTACTKGCLKVLGESEAEPACGAAWQAARRLFTGATDGFSTCPTNPPHLRFPNPVKHPVRTVAVWLRNGRRLEMSWHGDESSLWRSIRTSRSQHDRLLLPCPIQVDRTLESIYCFMPVIPI
jgi:hypothetical protein